MLGPILATMLAMTAGGAKAEDATANAMLFDFEHVSCSGAPNEIKLVVAGLEDSVGLLTVDLYVNDSEGFLKRAGRVIQRRAAARAPYTRLCIRAPQSGDYAIAVYHDENANKTFDKGAFGLPAEPWGISNNPRIRFAPPEVTDALFSVPVDGAKVFINLN